MVSNHELDKRYKYKQSLLDVECIKQRLISNDRVILYEVDDSGTGRLEIPSFITDIERWYDGYLGISMTPLHNTKYKEIYI